MQDNKFGEFDNFDDFLNDIIDNLEEDSPVPITDYSSHSVSVSEESHDVLTSIPENHHSDSMHTSEPTQSRYAIAHDNDRRKRSSSKSAVFFITVFFSVTAIAWALPLRPTVSVSEKRNLEVFPEFSISDLLSGSYFSSIDSWFSDTFTFRDTWMSISDGFKKSYGINDVVIYGDTSVPDSVPIPAPVNHEDTVSVKDSTISEILSEDTIEVSNNSAVEDASIVSDISASVEEEWGGITDIDDELIADKGGKLMIGDSVFLYPGFNEANAQKYAEIMNTAADLLEGKANYYCLIVPENVSSMLTREDREKYGFIIEEDALNYMYSLMDSNVGKVNVLENLQKHNDEYIVFRTDHHWTAVGAYYAYEEWCKYSGKTPVPLSEYDEVVWEDFYGTYYYASGEPKNLRDNPDDVHAFYPPGDVHLYLDFNNKDVLGEEYDVLLDRSVRKVDQYITFLTSDQAKATFVNNSIDDDSACVVMKDSFGNPFSYYLTQHYHYVYVLDLRYYGYRGIASFVDEFNVSDVIMVHSSGMCYSDSTLSVVKSLIR